MLTGIVSVWKYKNLHNFLLNAAAQKSYFAICRLGSVLRWARCIRGISKSLGSTIKCEHSETCFRFSLGKDSTTLILPFPPAASFSNIVISRTLPEESYGVARFFWCDFSKSEFGMDEEVANHVMYPIKFENRMTSFEVLRKLANHD